jgi:outer membrane lipoprotein SlyB
MVSHLFHSLEIIMKSFIAFFLALTILSGCSTANLRRADEVASVKRGIVTDIKAVTLAGSTSGLGGASGATAGALIGVRSSSGGSFTRTIVSMLAGEILGGIAGIAAEKKLTEADGVELTIKLDDGLEIAVPVKKDSADGISVGDRVRITQSGAKATVEKT